MYPVLVKPERRTLAFPFWKNQKSMERIESYLAGSKVLFLMTSDKKGQRVVVGGWRNSHFDHELGISVPGQRGEGLVAAMRQVWAGEAVRYCHPRPSIDEADRTILLTALLCR